MSHLKALKQAETISDLAFLLGYKTSALAYILYKMPVDIKYKDFDIPKKNGGVRVIHAPTKKLKRLQKRLAKLLYGCIDELKSEPEKLKTISGKTPQRTRAKKSVSHGFQQGLSIASNAEEHIRKRYVYNLDIKDFFPSFNFGRVRGFFIKNHKFQLKPKVATIIAQIACHKNSLPQGSPCSPVISNLIAEILDAHLIRLAKRNGCKYTRYADDLTFSTNQTTFPKEIAYRRVLKRNQWGVSKILSNMITSSGYTINSKKSHMQFLDSRQIVTGLVVNRVVNTKKEYYRYARSMCNSLFSHGYYTHPRPKVNYPKTKLIIFLDLISRSVKNRKIRKILSAWKNKNVRVFRKVNEVEGSIDQLEGILSHIYYVKSYRNKFAQPGYRDTRHDGYRKEKDKNGNSLYPPKNRSNQYSDESHLVAIDGIKNLYGKFLFFKYFHNLNEPLIFCEGKTDNVYLRCALKRLASDFPELIGNKDGKINYKIKFFNRTETASEMLKMAEGAGGTKYIMLEYRRLIKKYKSELNKYPVIMIVDNDKAGRDVIKASGCYSKVKSKRKFHLTDNLYLMTLPSHSAGAKDTELEDYFERSVLDSKLNGKSFNRKNEGLDTKKEYGKDHFSRFVVKKNQSTINFDAFKPLFKEITVVVKSHL